MFFFLGKSCHWLSVDTALYILKENETPENLQLVSFTEQQNKEVRCFCCIPVVTVISLCVNAAWVSSHVFGRNSNCT